MGITSDSTNKNTIQRIFCGITFLYCTVLLIINAIERANKDSVNFYENVALSDAGKNVLLNLNSNPILGLEVQSSDNCTGDLAILFSWETVRKYCDCGDTITRQYCSRGSSCKNRTKKSFSMSNWKGKKFCIRRLLPEEWTFSIGKSGSCPDYFRLCSGGICVKKSISECPITDLVISDTNPTNTAAHYSNITYFADSRSVFISRDKSRTPILEILASVPDVPCIDVRVGPKRTKQDSYPIIDMEPKGCNATRDFGIDPLMFFKLDEFKEWRFYEENVNMDYFLSLPAYKNFVGDEKIILYSKRKIEFKDEKLSCGSFDFGALTSFTSDLDIFNGLRFAVNLIVLIIASLDMILMIIFTLVEICTKSTFLQNLRISLLYYIFSFFLTVIIIIIQGIANTYKISVDNNSGIFSELAESNCFKVEVYNSIFQELKTSSLEGFDQGKSYNSAGLGLSITYLILLIVYFILICIRKKY